MLFSDGVSEAMSRTDDEFGESRLLELVQAGLDLPVETLVQQTIDAVRDFTTGVPQGDDITVMIVRYLGPSDAA